MTLAARQRPHGAAIATRAPDVAVVSAADARFFDLLCGMVRSWRDHARDINATLYIFDIGLTQAQRDWLVVRGARLLHARDPLCRDEFPPHLHLFMTRSRLPEILPGHDVYLWIDADAWIQSWDAVEAYIEGALRTGFAVTPEQDPAYDGNQVKDVSAPVFRVFGDEYFALLYGHAPINAGVFAGRADTPHWGAWRRLVAANVGKTDQNWLLFLLDQTALGIVCWQLKAQTEFLPATCNWLCHFSAPMVSDDGATLLRPVAPYDPLGIVHQTAHTKRVFHRLARRSGGQLARTVSYQARSQLPADEYVSPGLSVIVPDQCFPNMIVGDRSASGWEYLRRDVPHAWFVDRRIPTWGFLNRDEACILYNLALPFHGKWALEIGCLMGWSACHLALAGLDIDVMDPLLSDQRVADSVRDTLQASNFPGRVTLTARPSPQAVHELAAQRPGGWSFILIDGDHDGDAPLNDVRACEVHAAPDCAMVFHDLASPHVTRAVHYLHERGWRVRVYHTAQIMAVAWRGDVRPVEHWPDPRVEWSIPDHVRPLLGF